MKTASAGATSAAKTSANFASPGAPSGKHGKELRYGRKRIFHGRRAVIRNPGITRYLIRGTPRPWTSGTTVRVAAANENGIWNESGDALKIVIPPTFFQTRLFLALCVIAAILLLWVAYALRVRALTARMRNRLEGRVAERERIARELHDTLLQGVQGLILKFQTVTDEIPHDTPARQMMEDALDRADDVLIEGRDRVKDLRISPGSGPDLPAAIGATGAELAKGHTTRFNLSVEGTPRPLDPIVREEVLRIAHEAIGNAFRHARATTIEAEIIYHRAELRLRFRDDGCGIDGAILQICRLDHWVCLGCASGRRLSARASMSGAARGRYANKEVAIRLQISEETVKVHMKHILEKLDATDRTHAVTIALSRGIIEL